MFEMAAFDDDGNFMFGKNVAVQTKTPVELIHMKEKVWMFSFVYFI